VIGIRDILYTVLYMKNATQSLGIIQAWRDRNWSWKRKRELNKEKDEGDGKTEEKVIAREALGE
jgi:hypothetical protein